MGRQHTVVPPPASLVDLLGERAPTIQNAFLERAERSPDSTFLLWESRRWTYADAARETESLAAGLAAHASADRPRIASFLPNCPEAMWAWLATEFSGRVFVPINHRHRGALLGQMVERSKASVLITDAAGLAELEAVSCARALTIAIVGDMPRSHSSTYRTLPFAALRMEPRDAAYRESGAGEDTACVLYTSGTTGRSKAVLVRHNQYVRGAARLVDAYGLRADDVFHNWLPLCHLAGQLHMTMTAVLCGGAVALRPTFSTSQFMHDVQTYRCSVLCGFASILHYIWSLPPGPQDSATSLRTGIFAGIPAELHAPFERRFGMTLGENYGMTEIDPVTCPEPGVRPPEGSCGRASPDVEVVILGECDEPLAPGELGRIAVRPRVPNVLMAGYEDDDDATSRALRGGVFHTGDFGVLDDQGFLFFRGRASHYIRRRGENVSVAELESIVAGHPAVAECAAVGVPSVVGEEEIKVVVALREGATECAPADIHAFCAARMAGFMVPRYIEIVTSLPRGDLGKVVLSELRQMSPATWDSIRSGM